MTIAASHTGRLERLCGTIRTNIRAGGIERSDAFLRGQPFSPHRHDTYGIGITTCGVQTFRYRGERHHALPGQCHILHPDEPHDGAAGTAGGFGYRILHIDPALIQQALGTGGLPFVRSPVQEASQLPAGFAAEVWDVDAETDDMARTEIAVAAAGLLARVGGTRSRPIPLAAARVWRVHDLIAARPAAQHTMDQLEQVCGLDRWTLARQFRALFGTSPSRFRTQRQLDHVRRILIGGIPLAAASIDAGFADQSHMSRHFKRAYGLTPAAWLHAVRSPT